MTIRPSSRGTRPARARSSVVFPAPLGPRIAIVSPSAARSRALRSRSPSRSLTAASRLTKAAKPAVAQQDEHDDRDREQYEAQHDGRALLGFEEEIDREGHGLSSALDVAGKRDRGSELTEGARPCQRRTGEQ